VNSTMATRFFLNTSRSISNPAMQNRHVTHSLRMNPLMSIDSHVITGPTVGRLRTIRDITIIPIRGGSRNDVIKGFISKLWNFIPIISLIIKPPIEDIN